MASSAAPSSGASSPSAAGTTRTRSRGAASARRSSSASTVVPTYGCQPREATAEDDEARIEDVDQAGQPDAEPVADVVDGRQGPRIAGSRRSQDRVHGRPPTADRLAREPQQSALADLGLPAADAAAAAGRCPTGLTGMCPISPP